MYGGYADDEGDEPQFHHPAGPGGVLANLAAMTGGAWGIHTAPRAHPRAYDEYMKAYSVAMLPGKERDYLSYGGKIIMPPSALANLSHLDIESPWTFQLRNPSNPAASTHAGVLEFIAQEGVVHLPFWMMKTLRLSEGDPIRITGAQLPKGKLVKIQAQSTTFLEISDPKVVLEQALRNFSTLTQGDMIEIVYNSMVFEILIMEIKPEGPGISLLDTDLEVDFAPPKGYVEPKRPEPAPPETMASKLKIDLNSSTPVSSRPGSSLSDAARRTTLNSSAVPSSGASEFESFKGAGQTLNGRKTKGKGKSVRKIEEVDASSKIIRTDKARITTNDTIDDGKSVPAPLRLPHGKLFFGFPVVPIKPPEGKNETPAANPSPSSTHVTQPIVAFAGSGNTLSGRTPRPPPTSNPASTSRSTSASASSSGSTIRDSRGRADQTTGRRRVASPEIIEIDSD